MKKYIFLLMALMPFSLFSQEAVLIIEINGFENREGNINLTLFDQADGFPEDTDKSIRKLSRPLDSGPVEIRVENLKPGKYAFALLHDKDGNNKMNRNMLGIPKEGFAFSTNFRPKMSSPDFDDVSFSIRPGINRVSIEMIYM